MKIHILSTILAFLLCLTAKWSCSQPLPLENIQKKSLVLTDAGRSDRKVTLDLYYPTELNKKEPLERGMPLLVMGHGFAMSADAYLNFVRQLCPFGYVIALPTTESSLSPSHAAFGADLRFVGKELLNKSKNDKDFVLYKYLGEKAAVMGHSMGGGAAFLAVEDDYTFKTLVAFAPAETRPSAIKAAEKSGSVTALIFAGENDGVTPVLEHQKPIFEAMRTCGYMLTIKGGGHCFFADANLACSFGENSVSPKPTVTREYQQGMTFGRLLPWLDQELRQDGLASVVFSDSLDSRLVDNQFKCGSLTAFEDDFKAAGGKLYPNPATNDLQIEWPEVLKNKQVVLEIHNALGQLVHQERIENTQQRLFKLHLDDWAAGHYVLSLNAMNVLYRLPLVVQK